jgi:hypothetical protein
LSKDPTRSSGGSASPKKPLIIDLPAEEVRRESETFASADPAPAAPDIAPEGGGEHAGGIAGTAPLPQDEANPTDDTVPSPGAEVLRPHDGASRGQSLFPLIAASLAGGIVVALAILLLAVAGVPPFSGREERPDFSRDIATLRSELEAMRQSPADSDLAPLHAQIAALEQAIGDLRAAGSSEAPDQALREIQTRLSGLEQMATEVASTDGSPANDARLSELAAEIEALKSGGAQSSATEESIASLRQEMEQLGARLEAAPDEARVAAVETDLSEARRQAETAAALGPAVAADALAAAVESGRPFNTELDALVVLGADETAIAALRPYSQSGLATLAALQAGFENAIASLSLTAPIPEGTGTLDRLLQSARGLVEVRPAQPTEGADPAAIVTRIRGALAAGDVATALSEWQALPDPVKTQTAEWADAAEARAAADDLVARLRGEALARLTRAG